MTVAFDVLVLFDVFEHSVGDSLIALAHLVESVAVAVLDGVWHEGGVAGDVLEGILKNEVAIL